MSLQVWLPLTKDLRQQGLSNVTVTNNGATFNSAGKLGGCYNLTNGPINITNLPNPTSISVAFWFKRTANTNTRQFMFTAWNGVTCELTTDGTPTFAVYRNSYPTITGPTAITTSTGWIHYCGTFSPTEGMKMYLNGELVASNTNTTAISWSTTTGQIGKYGSYASMSAQMNDFRIYDHCLSPMEVKELAKGLVLHYPLEDKWCETVTNKAGTGFSGWNNSGAATRTSNDTTIPNPPTPGPVGSMTITTAGNCAVQIGTTATSGFASKTLTFSIWVWLGQTQDSNTIYIRSLKTDGNVGNFEYNGSTNPNTWPKEKWLYLTKTITAASDATGFYICTYQNVLNQKRAFNGWQVEEGSHANPWTAPGTTRAASTIEYDCSGFCNNGTRTGTFTWTGDTPKYQVSTSAQGSSGAKIIGPGMPAEAKSAAIWVKCAKTVNSVFFADKNSTLECGLLNSLIYANTTNSAGFTTTHWKDNQWNHVVVVNDNGTRRVYVNGESETASGANNYYMHTTDAVYLWTRSDNNSYPFNGQMSDFRIYATALSADDVKSLYQNSAYIDNSGNVYGAVHMEV